MRSARQQRQNNSDHANSDGEVEHVADIAQF